MENLVIAVLCVVLLSLACACIATPPEVLVLPPEEQAMANDVDPWGLGFADQLRLFRENYIAAAKLGGPTDWVLGSENGLTKVFRTKYWFRGSFTTDVRLKCARNEHENIQIAVIPDVGKSVKGVQLAVSELVCGRSVIAASNIKIYRVGYAKTVSPPYPVVHVGFWPDPLVPNAPIDINGADLGLFWVDIHVPDSAKPGSYDSTLTITDASGASRKIKLIVHVLPFALPKRPLIPMTVWTQKKLPWGEEMSAAEFEAMCMEFLDHGVTPLNAWSGLTDPENPESGDAAMERLYDAGLDLFDIPRGWMKRPKVIQHLRDKGWIGRALVYGAHDEPLPETFEKVVVPDTQSIRKGVPAPRVYLASDKQKHIDRGVDIWMTDLSTGNGLEYALANRGKADVWVYYCHLPINIGLCKPIVDAPNMLIDNLAIEQRLPYWIAWKYCIPGMFIWAGSYSWDAANKPDWIGKDWILSSEKGGYPYAGITNGNGFLVYPGAQPSIRLKILRDGMEDFAYLTLLKANLKKLSAKDQKEASELLKVPTSVLVNTHYFSRDPSDILDARAKVAALLVKAIGGK